MTLFYQYRNTQHSSALKELGIPPCSPHTTEHAQHILRGRRLCPTYSKLEFRINIVTLITSNTSVSNRFKTHCKLNNPANQSLIVKERTRKSGFVSNKRY